MDFTDISEVRESDIGKDINFQFEVYISQNNLDFLEGESRELLEFIFKTLAFISYSVKYGFMMKNLEVYRWFDCLLDSFMYIENNNMINMKEEVFLWTIAFFCFFGIEPNFNSLFFNTFNVSLYNVEDSRVTSKIRSLVEDSYLKKDRSAFTEVLLKMIKELTAYGIRHRMFTNGATYLYQIEETVAKLEQKIQFNEDL